MIPLCWCDGVHRVGMRDSAPQCDGVHYVVLMDNGAHSAGMTAPTTDVMGPIMETKMEDDGTHHSGHEISTTTPAGVDTGPSSVFCSPKGSSVDRPTLQEVATQLQGCVQRLQERRALVKIPPKSGSTLAPMPTVPHAEALVQAIVGTQPSPALPRLEKMQIQQDLETTRVHMSSSHC